MDRTYSNIYCYKQYCNNWLIGFFNNSPTPEPTDGPGRPVAIIDNIILTTDSDNTIPSVVLTTNAVSPVSGVFTVTATFSEPVNDFTTGSGDISVVNGTVSNLSAPTNNIDGTQTYTFDITPTVDGQITQITVNAGAATDNGNNPNTVSNTLSVLYDFTSPIISSVHIQSNNSQQTYATTGNVITLSYTLDDGTTPPEKQTVVIAGVTVVPVCIPSVTVVNGGDCTATLTVPPGLPVTEGNVVFSVSVDAGPGQLITFTTDGSFVIVDRIPPAVTITSPTPGTPVTGPFNLTGTCESGLDVIITAGGPPSNYKPNTSNEISVPCVDGTYSVALSPTGAVGTNVLIGSIEQVDLAGNHSNHLDATYPIQERSSTHVISITGPVGIAALGSNTVTGVCETGLPVTITGTGFDSAGTTPCVNGTYSFPIVITGNTTINACQQYTQGGDREAVIVDNCVTTSTTLPSVVVSSGGGAGVTSGGCIYGVNGCGTGMSPFVNSPNTTITTTNTIKTLTCPAFSQYLKQGMRDGTNGISEVVKVQSFLNKYLGRSISEDGVFGTQTKEAVKDFQLMNFSKILSPWRLSGPTGWWYQTTRGYANYLEGCTEGVVRLDNSVKIKDGVVVE